MAKEPLKRLEQSVLVETLETKFPFVIPGSRWDKKAECSLDDAIKYVRKVYDERRDNGVGAFLHELRFQKINRHGEAHYTFGILPAPDSLAVQSGDYGFDGYVHIKITPQLQFKELKQTREE